MPRYDDQDAVLREIGPIVPVILSEAIFDGFYRYDVSRKKDPDAYPEYSECTRANQLYDRIASSAKKMIDAVSLENPDVTSKLTQNKRAWDILLDTRFAFRVKRSKRNRKNLTTSVLTYRQRKIKSPGTILSIGQMLIPFADRGGGVEVPDTNRLWITVAFDLDAAEESIDRVVIGVEERKRFVWQRPLEAPNVELLATLPKPITDIIEEMRRLRSA